MSACMGYPGLLGWHAVCVLCCKNESVIHTAGIFLESKPKGAETIVTFALRTPRICDIVLDCLEHERMLSPLFRRLV
jgi:hypothetical protein